MNIWQIVLEVEFLFFFFFQSFELLGSLSSEAKDPETNSTEVTTARTSNAPFSLSCSSHLLFSTSG